MAVPFVGKRFTPEAFEGYLKDLKFGQFQPSFVTLHHTGAPSLAQRPQGFSDQHLQNLLHYYQNQLGWSGAPHVFVDDRPDGIIVFQRLDRQGVHAQSFNRSSWGVEMLGNYDEEKFHVGRGAKVRDLAMQTVAAMCRRLYASAGSIRFHREEPRTSKSCPGRNVSKPDVVARVAALLQAPPPADMDTEATWEPWEVWLPGGASYEPVHMAEGRPIAAIRGLVARLLGPSTVHVSADGLSATIMRGGDELPIRVVEYDAAGAPWGHVRGIASAAGHSIRVEGRVVWIE